MAGPFDEKVGRSQWFNGKHKRNGTLWERRFKHVVVVSI